MMAKMCVTECFHPALVRTCILPPGADHGLQFAISDDCLWLWAGLQLQVRCAVHCQVSWVLRALGRSSQAAQRALPAATVMIWGLHVYQGLQPCLQHIPLSFLPSCPSQNQLERSLFLESSSRCQACSPSPDAALLGRVHVVPRGA